MNLRPPLKASAGASCRRSKWLWPSMLWRLPMWLPTLKVRFLWLPYDDIESLSPQPPPLSYVRSSMLSPRPAATAAVALPLPLKALP